MKRAPLVIVALDAADPEHILAWARQGLLPAIRSILDSGAHGRLSGPEMLSVHGTWITFFSGVSLQHHGYYLSRQLMPGTYHLRNVDPVTVDAPPFWVAAAKQNLKALILDAFDTPLFPGMNGYQIANWGTHNTSKRCSVLPESLRSELKPQLRTDESQGMNWNDLRILQEILQRLISKGDICRQLLAKGRCDLAVVGFADAHAASHRFEKYSRAEHQNTNRTPLLQDAELKVYQAIDQQIAQLLGRFPEQPNVFVVSNSGIIDGYPIGSLMESFVRRLGYQHADNGRFNRELRGWIEPYLPSRWRLRSQARRFEKGIDWERTTAFAIPASYTGYLRVNLKGREPKGTVSPGKEYDAILDRLEEDLWKLADAETGEKVVERVVRTTSAFGGDPPLRLPDLFVDWNSSKRFSRRIAHPQTLFVQRRRALERGNYHSSSGLFLASGPAITRVGETGDFSLMDFAPLFRHLLNPAEAIPLSRNAGSLIS